MEGWWDGGMGGWWDGGMVGWWDGRLKEGKGIRGIAFGIEVGQGVANSNASRLDSAQGFKRLWVRGQ